MLGVYMTPLTTADNKADLFRLWISNRLSILSVLSKVIFNLFFKFFLVMWSLSWLFSNSYPFSHFGVSLIFSVTDIEHFFDLSTTLPIATWLSVNKFIILSQSASLYCVFALRGSSNSRNKLLHYSNSWITTLLNDLTLKYYYSCLETQLSIQINPSDAPVRTFEKPRIVDIGILWSFPVHFNAYRYMRRLKDYRLE